MNNFNFASTGRRWSFRYSNASPRSIDLVLTFSSEKNVDVACWLQHARVLCVHTYCYKLVSGLAVGVGFFYTAKLFGYNFLKLFFCFIIRMQFSAYIHTAMVMYFEFQIQILSRHKWKKPNRFWCYFRVSSKITNPNAFLLIIVV